MFTRTHALRKSARDLLVSGATAVLLVLVSLVVRQPAPILAAGDPVPAAEPAGNAEAVLTIDPNGSAGSVDSRLLGTNLPAWQGQYIGNNTLQARTIASGASVIRLPGGSWSNGYGWLSCEMGANQAGAQPCGIGWETWAGKPSDFITLLLATGRQAMYTVDINGTSKEAAAAVAFFNGNVNDTRSIGVDIHGFDWQTVGHWAQLRANHGHPNPIGIKLWEVGNEVYAGKSGKDCQSSGWENVWTCDGTEYVNGIGSGSSRHEGYNEFRNAMRAVDSSIQVGAVGFEDPAGYSNWGNEVIAAAGGTMDFYVVHPYAYYILPSNDANGYGQMLAKPRQLWPDITARIRSAFKNLAGGRNVPLAATEYNLEADQTQDSSQFMTRAANALFIADSIGQAAQNGWSMANQWDLINGRSGNGTEYGLMHSDNNFYRAPQYYVFPLWARFGGQMLPVSNNMDPLSKLSVYAGRTASGQLSLMAINKSGRAIVANVSAKGLRISGGTADVLQATSLDAQSVTFNNVASPSDDLANAPSRSVDASNGQVTYTFPANSVTLLRLNAGPSSVTTTAKPACFIPLTIVSR